MLRLREIAPPTQPGPARRKHFVFENILERQGFYIMSLETWYEYQRSHGGNFNEALNLVGMTAQPIKIGYKITYI